MPREIFEGGIKDVFVDRRNDVTVIRVRVPDWPAKAHKSKVHGA
jgi:hypothetical protein